MRVHPPKISHSAPYLQCRPPPPKKQRPKPLQPAESSRRSTRLQGSADEHKGQVPDDDRELALCLINEQCPRCGQVTCLPETLLLPQDKQTASNVLCTAMGFCCCKGCPASGRGTGLPCDSMMIRAARLHCGLLRKSGRTAPVSIMHTTRLQVLHSRHQQQLSACRQPLGPACQSFCLPAFCPAC